MLAVSESISSLRVAIMKSVMTAQAARRRKVNRSTGTPSSERNCLGVSAPIRVPNPAAGKMAVTRFIMASVVEPKSLHQLAAHRNRGYLPVVPLFEMRKNSNCTPEKQGG